MSTRNNHHTPDMAEARTLLGRTLLCCAAKRFAVREVILLYWKAKSSAANVFAMKQRKLQSNHAGTE